MYSRVLMKMPMTKQYLKYCAQSLSCSGLLIISFALLVSCYLPRNPALKSPKQALKDPDRH